MTTEQQRLEWAARLMARISHASMSLARSEKLDPMAVWLYHRGVFDNNEDGEVDLVPIKRSESTKKVKEAIQRLVMNAVENAAGTYSAVLVRRLAGESPAIFRDGELSDLMRELVSLHMRINDLLTPKSVDAAVDRQRRLRALETARAMVICMWRRRVSEIPQRVESPKAVSPDPAVRLFSDIKKLLSTNEEYKTLVGTTDWTNAVVKKIQDVLDADETMKKLIRRIVKHVKVG